MSIRTRRSHVVDLLFTLALFCVFTTTALIVVVIGANIYKTSTASMNENYQERTSLAYIAEKMRQYDVSEGIDIGDFSGVPALLLKQRTGDNSYTTYIYEYENQLKELYCKDGASVSLGDGETIMEIYEFDISKLNDQLLEFRSKDADGISRTLLISTHSS